MTSLDAPVEESRSRLAGPPGLLDSLRRGELGDPGALLGPHAGPDEEPGCVVRVYHPLAAQAWLLVAGREIAMESFGFGFFAALAAEMSPRDAYRVRFATEEGQSWERDDPYRFPSTISDFDLYLISEGTHQQLWESLGARPRNVGGVDGVSFAVWAPNARRVSVVGPFCNWDGRIFPMCRRGDSGVFEIFLPDVQDGTLYKLEIVGRSGGLLMKADPLARWAEKPPGTASRVFRSRYGWNDQAWMRRIATRDVRREPMAAYEVHLSSWRHGGDASYRDLAPRLVEHVKKLGFNYLELMPVAEHPYSGSWGYQITGYYAPTSRYGDPDDFRYFVDYCHQNGIGVILDWVPAHFVKDAHGLGRFDGTALYEHEDPRRGEHPDWGTYIFNYARFEVRNFLVANALYFFDQFHIDGLRVDAVASMLYLDYSRNQGEWLPNAQGGRENLDAIAFLREMNQLVKSKYPGRFVIAEESTTWPGVTKDVAAGGLGFTFKWNMGWMHDTLGYFGLDPLFRAHHQDKLTFGMVYEYNEAFVNPLSHDEVVHGKGSLWRKMNGDAWRKLANLRTLFTYLYTRPGKKLLFMGSELASPREWNHETGLDWYLLEEKDRRGLFDFVAALGQLYEDSPCLWQLDHEPGGFRWISCEDRARSVLAFARFTETRIPLRPEIQGAGKKTAKKAGGLPTAEQLAARGASYLITVMNLTPLARNEYLLGVPEDAAYRVALSSDARVYGGAGYPTPELYQSQAKPHDGYRSSIKITLPPLSALVLAPQPKSRA
jgi:1,4-alpha-glucan branching enzyme